MITTHAAPARKTSPAARASIVASAELRARNASPRPQTRTGNMDDPHALQKPLLLMVQRGDIDGVRMFIEAGANINHVWDGGGGFAPGDTALSLAIYSMMQETNPSANMVNALLALGADASGDTHFLFAAIGIPYDGGVNPDLVAALVAAGADVQRARALSGFWYTPLHIVVENIGDPKKAVSVANFLISKGALVDAKDERGETPLDYALRVVEFINPCVAPKFLACNRTLAKCLLRGGASTTGCRFAERHGRVREYPAKTLVDLVIKRGGWKKYALWHKQVLVGLVTKCKPMPDDAAGLVVDFYCPSGGS